MNDCVERRNIDKNAGLSWRGKVVFALIFLLAVALRVINITEESVWWDEFATVAFLKAPVEYESSPYFERWNQEVIRADSPTFDIFLKQNRLVDPAAMPLYLMMEYYWNRWVHASPLALRFLSIFLGLLILPLLYLLGVYLFDRKVALIAMFCLALSPIHVQFSQEIRMYGLMTLLALAAVYAFCRLYTEEEKKYRWWFLYGLSILLLSWTHPFSLLLPVVMGLFWIMSRPRDFWRAFKWGALTAVLVLPAVLWVLAIQFWGQESTDTWLRLATVRELIHDIFTDDAIGTTFQLNASSYALEALVGHRAGLLIASWRWPIGDLMLVATMVSVAGLWVLALYRWYQARRRSEKVETSVRRREIFQFFLSLWLILPPLILFVISLLWRPCLQPRYTVHASLALYLLLGCAIVALPWRRLRITAIVLLVLFYGYQQMLMQGEAQHPNWLGASQEIRDNANEDDLILAHNWLWKRVFVYNLGPLPNIVCYGSTYEILAEKTAFFLDPSFPLRSRAAKTPSVWVVIQTDYFTEGTIKGFEDALAERGLAYTPMIFGGIQRVILYRVQRSSRTPAYAPLEPADSEAPKEFAELSLEYWRAALFDGAVAAAQNALRINPEYARAWSYLGMAYKEQNRQEEAMDAFSHAVAIDPHDYPWSLSNYGELLILSGRYSEAVDLMFQALELLPDDPWCLALLGRAQGFLKQYGAAHQSLSKAAQQGDTDIRIFQWLEELEKEIAESRSHE
ncbi:MAG: tetratricopeptide repeat protein [Candidatus Hydrogenedentes bacterium]|jgi:tetratricopeptide (TPR) repeat protein|nr:tetratricopeptide repeat protein [Candidatus Hydrogenedentota bacterium]